MSATPSARDQRGSPEGQQPLDPNWPKVTVFLPTWNGGELLEEVLRAIKAQKTPFAFEILAIDSSSSDDTVERLKRHEARVIQIPQSEFNHGLTRNRGVSEARGEIVVLTVQDATPASDDWLVKMTEHFADEEVAGVYCHQVPRPDCNPFLKARLRTWMSGGDTPTVSQVKSPEVFWNRLTHIERYHAISFDNVSSAVRKATALELPFPERRFGEDVTWAKSAILSGKKIVKDPRVAVIHSHDNSLWYEFKRTYMDHQNLNDLVGLRLVPRLRDVVTFSEFAAKQLSAEVWKDQSLPLWKRCQLVLQSVPFAIAMNAAQYLGQLSNRQGRTELWRTFDRIMGHHV